MHKWFVSFHVYLIETGAIKMDFEDLPNKKSSSVTVGESLYDLSIEELHERLDLLHMEIDRLETEIVNKKSTKTTADSIFKI